MAQATARLMFDTDVLVEYLRGRPPAVRYFEAQSGPLLISVVSAAELFVGARTQAEITSLDEFLRAFITVPIDKAIARSGGLIRRQFGPSHGVGLADALIAATAQAAGSVLVTFNLRHFPMVEAKLAPYQMEPTG